jgi:hypothetical protein
MNISRHVLGTEVDYKILTEVWSRFFRNSALYENKITPSQKSRSQHIATGLIKALLDNGSLNKFQHMRQATIRLKCFLCDLRHATVLALCRLERLEIGLR